MVFGRKLSPGSHTFFFYRGLSRTPSLQGVTCAQSNVYHLRIFEVLLDFTVTTITTRIFPGIQICCPLVATLVYHFFALRSGRGTAQKRTSFVPRCSWYASLSLYEEVRYDSSILTQRWCCRTSRVPKYRDLDCATGTQTRLAVVALTGN